MVMKLQPPPGGEEILGDVALEAPPGGEAIVGDAEEASWREIAMGLAKQIYGASPKSGLTEAFSDPADMARGLYRGVRREDLAADDSTSAQVGQMAGRYLLPVGAALMAGRLAPAALVSGAPTALTGALGTAAAGATAEGAAAAAGDAASMGLSKAIGGNAPETVGQAVLGASKTGLETALASLSGSALISATRTVAPHILQSMKVVPAESLARMIEKNGKPLMGNKLTQTGADLRASVALRRVQRAAEAERTAVGNAVDAELTAFQSRVGGKPVINTTSAADALDDVLQDAAIGVGNDAVDAAAKASDAEIKLLQGIAEKIREKPAMSPIEAVSLRRRIDDLTEYRRGGAPQISSAVGERAARAMAAGLRESIGEAAGSNGAAGLLKANQRASRFFGQYDSIRPEISSPRTDSGALLARVKNIAGKFNEGGLPKARLEGLSKILPKATKDVDNLLDYVAAREFLRGVKETPSGISMAHARGIITALGTARLLPLGQQAAALVRLLPRIGAGVASKANQK